MPHHGGLEKAQEGMGKAEPEGLRLPSLNNFSRLWGIRSVPRYLVPKLGVIRGNRGPECMSLIKEETGV